MSFSFSAQGTAAEVVASLDGLTTSQIGFSNFANNIREAIVEAVSAGTDLEPPADQRYSVSVSGHDGRNSLVALSAEVKVITFTPPPEAQPADVAEVPVTDGGTGTETIQTTA